MKARINKKVGARKQTAAPAPAANTADLLDIGQALALLKTSQPTFYRWVRSGKIKGIKVGRQWRFRREDLDRFLKGEAPAVSLPVSIQPLIDSIKTFAQKAGIASLPGPDENEVLSASILMIVVAQAMRASDLHLYPTMSGDGQPIALLRIRIDGILQTVADFDLRLLPALVERWKIMANCNTHELRKPQDGRIQIKIKGEELDIRACFLPASLGENVTLRILTRQSILTMDKMPIPPAIQKRIEQALQAPQGMILVSGPSGSGKTTLLYACLMKLNQPGKMIMTIENPVEYLLTGVVHANVIPEEGMTFPAAIRSILRSDPDVIMIGEINDPETLRISQMAALYGHLILTSIRAPDAMGVLKKMADLGAEPFTISDTTRLILSQRLIRILCPKCARPMTLTPELLAQAQNIARQSGLDWTTLPSHFREPVGCPHCNRTGFCGRTVCIEALEMNSEITQALMRHASAEELRAIAIKGGMVPLAGHALQRAAEGEVHLTEALAMTIYR